MDSSCLFRDRLTFTHVKHKHDSKQTYTLTRNTCTIFFFLTRAVSLSHTAGRYSPHLENLKPIFFFFFFRYVLCGIKTKDLSKEGDLKKKKNDAVAIGLLVYQCLIS